jgi:hypothetical protein
VIPELLDGTSHGFPKRVNKCCAPTQTLFRIVPAKCFSPWGFAFQRTTAVDAWNSPERLTPRPGIQIRSNRRRFSGCAALDGTDNYCRQYDEVKERNHWYQEKPNCVHISTSSSIFGRPAFAVKNF